MVILGGRVGVGLAIVADDLGAARAVCIVLQASWIPVFVHFGMYVI